MDQPNYILSPVSKEAQLRQDKYMIVLRDKMFSDKKEDSTAKDIKLAAAGGLLVGGKKLGEKLGDSEYYRSLDTGLSRKLLDENEELLGKLHKKADKQRTSVFKSNKSGSFYNKTIADDVKKDAKDNLRLNKKEFRNFYKGKPLTDQRVKDANDYLNGYKRILKSKDVVSLGSESEGYRSASSLAHELGHSQHFHGRPGSMIGKLAHKIGNIQKNAVGKLNEVSAKKGIRVTNDKTNKAVGVIAGLASGINAGKKEREGKKEGMLSKTAWITAPTAFVSPTLIAEGEASRQGLKMLKKAGASKAYMGVARKHLGHAFGTYAASVVAPLAMGYGARQIGKVIGKKIYGPKDPGDEKKK